MSPSIYTPDGLPMLGSSRGSSYEDFVHKGTSPKRYMVAGIAGGTAGTTGTLALGTIYALPFIVGPFGGVIDELAISVTTAATAGGVLRLGIYDNSNDSKVIQPKNLLYGSGDIADTTTGVKTQAVNLVTNPNSLLWIVAACGVAAPGVRALAVAACVPILGVDSAFGTAFGIGWTNTFTYGAFPNPFPVSPTPTVLSATPVPALGVHFT